MKHVTIIAEAGVNHNGSLETALELIRVAADAGADYVKFQTFNAVKLASPEARKATYQTDNKQPEANTQLEMLRKLEIPVQWYPVLQEACSKQGIQFLSTAFDPESLDFLKTLDLSLFKIPSGELTNKPYLRQVAGFGKPVILSTGMAALEEISAAMEVLTHAGVSRENLTVLHCNTQYPTPMEDVNLRAMRTIADTFGVATGYSDHTIGIEVPIAAVALGAIVIEKHFTLDKDMEGPDHKASLEPQELKAMVAAIRNIERALGSSEKNRTASEAENVAVARKSIHLAADLKTGDRLQEQYLEMLRPGDGISPMELEQLTGKRLKRDLPKGTKLTWNDFE